ncbi:unknown [Sutterella sp. CAG:351]|nr:unknown [Sutterella sp. CAG:351]
MNLKLPVGRTAVNLNGLLRNAQPLCHSLIGGALGYHADHLAFALREGLELRLEAGNFSVSAAGVQILQHGVADRVQ